MEKQNKIGISLLIITSVMWSTGGLLIKLLPNMNALAINGIRSGIAFLVMLIYFKKLPKITFPIVLTAVCFALVGTLFVIANKLTTAANTIVLQYTAPIYVLIFSSIAAKKFPKLMQILVILLAFGGIVMVFMSEMQVGNMLGNALALLAGLFFSLVYFLNSLKNSNPQGSTMLGLLICFIVGIPFYFGITDFTLANGGALLGLGVFQLGVPYILFCYGVKHCSPTTASMLGLVEAILNPIWVFAVTGEAPTTLGIIGCVVVLIALAVNIIYEGKTSKNVNQEIEIENKK